MEITEKAKATTPSLHGLPLPSALYGSASRILGIRNLREVPTDCHIRQAFTARLHQRYRLTTIQTLSKAPLP